MTTRTRKTGADPLGTWTEWDVYVDGQRVGEVWSHQRGAWHAKVGGTQLTKGWRTFPTKRDAVAAVEHTLKGRSV